MIKAESNVFYSSTEIKTTERNNVECSLNLTEENADKILDLTGKVYQSAADKEGDLVVFGGLATFNAVFVGDELMRIEVGAKFSFKTAMPGADADVSDVKHALEGVSPSGSASLRSSSLSLCPTVRRCTSHCSRGSP